MRVTKAFLIAAALSLPAAPLAAQAANETAPADNAVTDLNATDANALDANAVDANLVAPVDDTVVAEEAVETEPAAPADDGGGFPWGVLGLLGLLGLIPRLRR